MVAELGFFLSSEEHGPNELVSQARQAEEAGFRSILVSDHYHPWVDRQGESPFVWSVIGGIAATTRHRVTTGVTCPLIRIHPAVLAQATATAQLMLGGRFVFGVGSGEALNEHILGDGWPPAPVRLEMLEEAVSVIRELWTGKLVTHRGRHYRVENAKLYSRPDRPPPVPVSAFGADALALAVRIGDGLVTTEPDREAVESYRRQGGRGPVIGAVKVCVDSDESRARKLVHDLWATEQLPGQLGQELSLPAFYEQAASLVSEDMAAASVSCGPDPERHLAAILEYLDAGFDEVYVNQVGPDQPTFLDFYRRELLPRLSL